MKYAAWLRTADGKPSPFGPSPLYADGIVAAQRKAAAILAELQEAGALEGWTLHTVTDYPTNNI